MHWPVLYNQSLVRRGEILLGFDVINNWKTELKEINRSKFGQPFHYPNTFLLLLLGYAKPYFYSSYRQTEEGIPQGHAKGKLPYISDFTTTCKKRINKLNIQINNTDKDKVSKNEYTLIAIDRIGIKVTNRGQGL